MVKKILLINPTIQPCGIDILALSAEMAMAKNGEEEALISHLSKEKIAAADVAAVPVRDAKRGEEVKIYVELKEGFTPDDLPVERILDHARAHLAVFKVPRYIAFIPALPRAVGPSNKVLKRELMGISDPLSGAYDSEEKRWC